MLGRVLAWIRPGFVTDPTLQPRLSTHEVLGMVGASFGPGPRPTVAPIRDMAWAGVALIEGRLVWTACISDRGVTTCSTIDDATGAAGSIPIMTPDDGRHVQLRQPIGSLREPVQRPVFWVALACTAAVDAAAGVLAGSIAILSWPGTGCFAMVFVTAVTLGGMCHAMTPGWLLLREPGGPHAFKLRTLTGFHALGTAMTVLVVLLLAMVAAGSVVPSAGLVLLAAIPPIITGITGLGAAWAQAVDPRTRLAAPPIVRAECLAATGAIIACAVPGALLAAGVLTWPTQAGQGSWWPGLLLGAYLVMAAPMPLNVLVTGDLVGAGGLLAPVGTMARRAVVCGAVLLTAAATLLVVSR